MTSSKMVAWEYENWDLDDLYDALASGNAGISLQKVNISYRGMNIPLGHLVFRKISSPRSTINRLIDYSSLCDSRLKFVKAFLDLAWSSNYSFASVRSSTGKLRAFLSFFDSGSYDISSKENSITLVQAYSSYLTEKTRLYRNNKRNGISSGTAYANQKLAIETVEQIVGYGACKGIRRIKNIPYHRTSSTPPSENDLALHLNHYTSLFVQFSKFLMDKKDFPWRVNMHDKDYFVFPFRAHLTSIQNESSQTLINIGLDYETGKLREKEEIDAIVKASTNLSDRKRWLKVHHHYNLTRRILNEANADNFGQRRRLLATIAIRAYLNHFLIVTGVNDNTAATLDLKDIEIFRGKRKFRAIKLRAGGRVLEFEIQNIFMKYFDLYLELRKFILEEQGEESSRLFFELPQRTPDGIRNFREDGHATADTSKMDPFSSLIPHLTSRQYRVAKGQWIARKNGIEAASFSLQHGINTNSKAYNEANQDEVDTEVSKYLDLLGNSAVKKQEYERNETVSGGCSKKNTPTNIGSRWKSFKPDCDRFEGCVFCDQYVVHADEVDLRKLYSMRFVVEKHLIASGLSSAYKEIVEPFLKRIDVLINRINTILGGAVIQRIRDDVYENENLAPYWFEKYEMLDELGVL